MRFGLKGNWFLARSTKFKGPGTDTLSLNRARIANRQEEQNNLLCSYQHKIPSTHYL